MPRADVFFSAGVETDGPIPGPFSMLSFALTGVGRYDGAHFERFAERSRVHAAELKPIADAFEPEALAVNGLDRERLSREGLEPENAMNAAGKWIRELSGDDRPVLVAYPVVFDWSFLYWYFERFAEQGSPFGHSSCLDIRTLYLAAAGSVFDESGKASMPSFLRARAPHTHDALDEAVEQGELFANVFAWNLKSRHHGSRRPERAAPEWLREQFIAIT